MSKKRKPVNTLMRSPNQRILGGVCGGIAEKFNTDPLWWRVLFLVLILFAGIIIIVYIVLWIIIPLRKPTGSSAASQDKNSPPNGKK